MTFAVPYSLSAVLFLSAVMQRSAANNFRKAESKREEYFSLCSSYVCLALALAALAAALFLPQNFM